MAAIVLPAEGEQCGGAADCAVRTLVGHCLPHVTRRFRLGIDFPLLLTACSSTMSSAHRPTWNPAEGKADERHKSARVAARHLPSHTKLKFRQAQQGAQASNLASRNEDVRRDLKRELEMAERESRNKKRKEQGLAPEVGGDDAEEDGQGVRAIEGAKEDGEEAQRRRLIEEMKRLDGEDEESDGEGSDAGGQGKGKGAPDSASSASSDDEDEDDDDTAALLRELEKIKRERAEEKARQEKERADTEQSNREDEIALGNPLLNLENAMKGGGGTKGKSGGAAASFGVKRRWDDDVIFKNQAAGNESDKSGFVNDLTRECTAVVRILANSSLTPLQAPSSTDASSSASSGREHPHPLHLPGSYHCTATWLECAPLFTCPSMPARSLGACRSTPRASCSMRGMVHSRTACTHSPRRSEHSDPRSIRIAQESPD